MWAYDLPWILGYAVLIFIWVIPLLVLWSISFCFIRCKKDPARTGMVWIKIVYPLWLASSVLYTVQAALWAWYDKIMENRDYMIYDPMLKVDLEAAQFHTGELAMLLSRTADICLLVTLIELASGFIICLNEGSPPPFRKRIRYITFALASVLFILSVIVFALRTSHRLVYLNAQMDLGNYHQDEFPSLPYDDLYNHYEMLRRFDRAIRFLIWIASVATLVYVSYATHQTKVNRILRKFISPLLACSILDMLRLLAISFFYPYDSYFFSYSLYIPTMLGGFVNYVFMFIILIILYCIGFRKSKGLWSTPQKWNTIGSDKVNEFPPTAPAGMSPFYPPPTTQEATQQPGMPWQPHQQTRPPSYNPQHPSFATQQPQEQQLPLYYPQTTQIQGHHHQQQPINPNPQHPPLLQPLEIPEPTYQQSLSSTSPSSSSPRTQLQPTRLQIDEQKVLLFGPPPSSPADRVVDGFKYRGGDMSSSSLSTKLKHQPPLPHSLREENVADGFQMQPLGGNYNANTVATAATEPPDQKTKS